jgi:MSHA type pilus biogenesis protein MshL
MKTLFGIISALLIVACAQAPSTIKDSQATSAVSLSGRIKAESDEIARSQQELHELNKKLLQKLEIEPVMPVYDPLEDHIVSFSMVDEDLQMVLYSLSRAVGMNLIIDPSIKKEDRLLTLNFEKVSAATMLKEILNTFDLYYETVENVIRVNSFQERIFRLNLLDTEVNTKFDIGGDVLGAGDTESASGLSGSFKLTGKGASRGNVYDVVEEMTKRVMSGVGKYSLNRLSGSLFVKDKPSTIRVISKLINHFNTMLSRQILIEARIIEVALSDEYKYGIDWNIIRDGVGSLATLTSASWSMGRGLIFNNASGKFSIGAAVNALSTFGDAKVVSNPTIRAKHGKPAIISVGTSYTYKKSVEVTNFGGDSQRDTTEVEVSTVFDGLILGVIPFIEENGKISLLINPIKSDVDRDSLEPESVGSQDGNTISLPRVRIKEISTTITVENDSVIILGGLIDKYKTNLTRRVPFLSLIPIIGYFFKNEIQSEETRELVIILRASLI